MFFQQDLNVFTDEYVYSQHDAVLLKLIFPTYSVAKMAKHGFEDQDLSEGTEWYQIDQFRKRKNRNNTTQ